MYDPVKIGLVGLGFGACWYKRKRAAIEEYLTVVAGCDTNAVRRQSFEEEFHLECHNTLDELLARRDIEAVALFTPPGGRADLIRKCAAAGKHVLTTKPFERNADAAYQVLEEVRNAGLVVQLNSPAPTPAEDLHIMEEWRDRYRLGRPIAADWETYVKYHEQYSNSWMDSFDACPVAPIFRLGIYGINELILLLGNVRAVQVAATRLLTGRPTPDNARLLLEFSSGAIGSVYASFCVDDSQCFPGALRIHYENGTICKRQLSAGDPNNRARFSAVELTLQGRCNGQVVSERREIGVENRSGEYQLDRFVEAVRTGNSASGRDSSAVIANGIAVIEAMASAESSHRRVEVKMFDKESNCLSHNNA